MMPHSSVPVFLAKVIECASSCTWAQIQTFITLKIHCILLLSPLPGERAACTVDQDHFWRQQGKDRNGWLMTQDKLDGLALLVNTTKSWQAMYFHLQSLILFDLSTSWTFHIIVTLGSAYVLLRCWNNFHVWLNTKLKIFYM